MKKCLVVTTVLALVAVLATSCVGVPSMPTPTSPTPAQAPMPTGEDVNFRLLISDEVNAIGDFDELNITITRIGVHQAGEENGWTEYDLDPSAEVDLTDLTGDNATELWSGELLDGEYTKVFLYVDVEEISWVPAEGVAPETIEEVKLPSEKMQISKPFTISSENGQVVNFVFDITVVKTGKSGQYILLPQIAQSGPDQDFKKVAHLYLRQKNPETWEIVEGGAWGKLKYNLSGPTFDFVFNGHSLQPNTEYSLIYYADFEDKFTDWGGNNPGALIASGTSNEDGGIHLEGPVELNMDLPSPPDANIDVHDYSGSPDYYAHAHGAKIWLVPSADYDAGLFKVTTWDPGAFLFETDLINYDDTD